jgi:hypothetical protein
MTRRFALISAVFLFAVAAGCGTMKENPAAGVYTINMPNSININIPALENGLIPGVYTCDGRGISPEITISGTPSGTKTLALIMTDPDIPGGGVYDHWVVWNIPPATTDIPTDSTPAGAIVGRNSAGQNNYTSPCPPDREHRYFFNVYALDATLDLPSSANKSELLQAIEGHVLAQGEIIGRYNRPK